MSLPPHERELNLAVWAALWSAVLVWQGVAVARGGRGGIASLVRFARRWWTARWALLLAWAWLGWHLFVRTTPG